MGQSTQNSPISNLVHGNHAHINRWGESAVKSHLQNTHLPAHRKIRIIQKLEVHRLLQLIRKPLGKQHPGDVSLAQFNLDRFLRICFRLQQIRYYLGIGYIHQCLLLLSSQTVIHTSFSVDSEHPYDRIKIDSSESQAPMNTQQTTETLFHDGPNRKVVVSGFLNPFPDHKNQS